MSMPGRMLLLSLTLTGLVPGLLAAQEITREHGYDRRGGDYTSFHARSLSACVETCRDDGRCRAFSYDTQEGTCYLKERVNSAQRKEDMVTGYKQEDDRTDDGSSLTEERGYDRRGGDYTSFQARSLSDCKGACRRDRRCRAYSYDTQEGGCYLKERVNRAQRKDEMVTGFKNEDDGDDEDYDDVDSGLTEERGYDRRGNDYTSFRASSLRDCTEACRKDNRCRAYTFDTRNDACYLKDRVNSSQRNDSMVTGYKRDGGYGDDDDGYSSLTEEEGYDRRGNDYTSFRARDLSDCQNACRRDGRCRAYTYDTRNDACFLKDRVNSAREDDDMVTGYKRDGD